MHIHRLTAFHVPIALKRVVRHASHERSANDTLIVKCVLNDGSVGWGEGLPRMYVTGDSIESVWRQLKGSSSDPLRAEFDSPVQAAALIEQQQFVDVAADAGVVVRECFGNAARCALELAVLDAATKAAGQSMTELLRGCSPTTGLDGGSSNKMESGVEPPHSKVVRYSGVITSESAAKQCWSALKMKAFGFHHIKVKLGSVGQNDSSLLRRVRRIVGRSVDLRGDANEAWHCEEVADKVRPLEPFRLSCLEQPVPHEEVSGLKQVRREVAIPIMLDESLCCLEDAQRAVAGGWCDAFNVRLSKCGGLMRSLAIVAFAQRHGIALQLGCQVGETGILSAAGRHFACVVSDFRYVEGSYDRFLVRDRLTEQDLTFGYGGIAPALTSPGLGVTVDECRVRALAVRSMDVMEP